MGSQCGFRGDRRELLQMNKMDVLRSDRVTCGDWPGWKVDTPTVRCSHPTWGKNVSGEGQVGTEALKWERLGEIEDRSEDSEAGT